MKERYKYKAAIIYAIVLIIGIITMIINQNPNLNKQIITFLIIFAIADFIACWISIFKYKAKIKNDARYLVDLDNEIEKYENEKSRN